MSTNFKSVPGYLLNIRCPGNKHQTDVSEALRLAPQKPHTKT